MIVPNLRGKVDDILYTNQHGFRKTQSRTIQLATVSYNILKHINKGKVVHEVVFDFLMPLTSLITLSSFFFIIR